MGKKPELLVMWSATLILFAITITVIIHKI